MRKLVIALAILPFYFIAATSYAQSANVPVTANILAALSIQHISGDLNFGNIVVTGNPQTPQKTPENGAVFEVTGNNSTPITVTFTNVTLNNSGSGSMTFTPSVEHTTANTYSGASAVSSGGSITITTGGKAWLRVGGSSGTFTISVAY
jgi:hypothetical protein